MTERLAPVHDLDAEAAVLATLMLDPDRVADVEEILSPANFYAVANQRIAEAIWELDHAAEAIDVATVAAKLNANGRLAQIGGTPYLMQVSGSTPAVAHVEDHARIVATAARIRRVQAVCQLVASEAYTAMQGAPEWLQSVEARILAATDAATMRPETISVLHDAATVEFEAIRDRANGKTASGGHMTRIAGIDRVLHGLKDGVPYVVAGRPGHGKTALAWQIADGIAQSGDLVVFLSQEMPRPQLVQRAIAQCANLEPEQLESGRLDAKEWSSVANAVGTIQRLPIAIDDRAGHTVHGARSSVRRCVQKLRAAGHAGRLGLVVLDYLQIMGGERQRGESRSTEVADNMHGITRLAKEFGCPVLVLSQLNREIDKRPEKRPRLSDLGESGAIEADAYAVIFAYREDCYREESSRDGLAEIIIAKHRNGRTGDVKLRYLPSTMFAGVVDEFDAAADAGDDWRNQ
jgi:replicative DNA helicase